MVNWSIMDSIGPWVLTAQFVFSPDVTLELVMVMC